MPQEQRGLKLDTISVDEKRFRHPMSRPHGKHHVFLSLAVTLMIQVFQGHIKFLSPIVNAIVLTV